MKTTTTEKKADRGAWSRASIRADNDRFEKAQEDKLSAALASLHVAPSTHPVTVEEARIEARRYGCTCAEDGAHLRNDCPRHQPYNDK